MRPEVDHGCGRPHLYVQCHPLYAFGECSLLRTAVGTAFAFGTRFLFTASHVLDPPEGWAGDSVPEMVYLAARDNSLVVAAVVKVLYRDRDLDVAILECGTAEFSPLSLRYAEGIKNYEPVYTVDVIDHSYAIVHKGSCYPGSTKMELLMDARTFQGFNGGPILDESGEVVGMCLGTWGASGRAVTSDGLRHVYNAARALGIDCNLWSDKSWGFQQDNIRAIPTNGHGASGASGGSPPGRGRQSAFASVHRAVYMERAPSIEEFMTKRWLPAGTVPSRYATILDGLEPAPLAPRAGDVHGPPYSHSQPINREMAPRGWRSSDPRSSSGSNGGGPSRENDSSTMIGDGTDPGAGLAGWNTSSQDSQASQASQSSAAATAGGTSVTDESVGYEGDESMGDEPDGGEPMEDVSEGDESG